MSGYQTRWCFSHHVHVYDDDSRCDDRWVEIVFKDPEQTTCDIADVVVVRKDVAPSIVVGGKVVPIFDDAGDVAEWAWIAATTVASRTQGEAKIARLLDAAREVARGEER